MSADEGHTHSSDTDFVGGEPQDIAMDLYNGGYVDPVYQAKARILNRSIQDIGMGKYQVGGFHGEIVANACSLAVVLLR